ncbi:VIT1/CCC1 transporter family protein [Roseococcus sp. DSY-14]|uniref:VIT1/CCC1 transporter family protein n=1 Tax=Roseococcus sp. DSY-14 TaxID=3369650 RepID=UPI00387AA96B
MDDAPHPYRDGLPPAPPGPPEGEQHRLRATAPLWHGLALAPVPVLALASAPRTAVLAALAAAALAAWLLPWLRALAAAERHAAERQREEAEILEWPERERWEVAAVLHRYGLRGDALARAVEQIAAEPRRWVDFMMRFELDLIQPRPGEAARDGALAGAALAAGALALMWLPAGTAMAAGLALAALAGALAGRAAGENLATASLRALALPLGALVLGLSL